MVVSLDGKSLSFEVTSPTKAGYPARLTGNSAFTNEA
jgi:hypothetical protein